MKFYGPKDNSPQLQICVSTILRPATNLLYLFLFVFPSVKNTKLPSAGTTGPPQHTWPNSNTTAPLWPLRFKMLLNTEVVQDWGSHSHAAEHLSCNRGFGFEPWICQLQDSIIYFWLTNWDRWAQHLALETRGEKLSQEGWWWHITSKVAGTCCGASLWNSILNNSYSHNSAGGRLQNNPPQNILNLKL